MSEKDFGEIERRAIPGSGSCGGMYTANTMSSAFEALGMSLPYSSTMANVHDEIVAAAKTAARVLVEAVRRDLKPRDIVTRRSIENAVAVIMATGGSTNAVLHFLAIAHAAEVEWTIDDFERVRRKVPVLCDLKPSGRYLAVDLHRAGGIPQVMKILLEAGICTATASPSRQDTGRDARRAARRTGGPGCDPPHRPADVRARPPRHPARKPVAGGLGCQDHRPQEPGHYRAGARLRRRAVGHGGDHGAAHRRGRRDGAALPRAEGRARACRRCWRRRARSSARASARASAS
jgi:hypothetical protein